MLSGVGLGNLDPRGLSRNRSNLEKPDAGRWGRGVLSAPLGSLASTLHAHMHAGRRVRDPSPAGETVIEGHRQAPRKQLCRQTHEGPAHLKCTHEAGPHPAHCPAAGVSLDEGQSDDSRGPCKRPRSSSPVAVCVNPSVPPSPAGLRPRSSISLTGSWREKTKLHGLALSPDPRGKGPPSSWWLPTSTS